MPARRQGQLSRGHLYRTWLWYQFLNNFHFVCPPKPGAGQLPASRLNMQIPKGRAFIVFDRCLLLDSFMQLRIIGVLSSLFHPRGMGQKFLLRVAISLHFWFHTSYLFIFMRCIGEFNFLTKWKLKYLYYIFCYLNTKFRSKNRDFSHVVVYVAILALFAIIEEPC